MLSKKHILTIAIICVLALLLGSIYKQHAHKQTSQQNIPLPSTLSIDGSILKQARIIAPFHLAADHQKEVTKDTLTGHWSLVFFGFSNCGYVCPTTLAELNIMYQQLEKDLAPPLIPQIIMISVDPQRDTPKRMHSYVTSFNKDFIGLSGDIKQIKALAAQMSAVFMVTHPDPKKPNVYTINHSAEIMLLDPAGNLRAFLSYPHTATVMAKDYEKIMQAAYSHR